MIEGRATARYVRTSAHKAKLVMDLIRGQDVDRALSTLRFARKRIARDIEKVLRSAVANAQQREGASGDVDRMFVSRCYADQGPSMKRIRPAPMGRAFRIIKRSAHLTVHIEERPEVVTRVVAPAPAGDGAATTGATKTARKTATPPGKTATRQRKKTAKTAAKKLVTRATTKKTAAEKATVKTTKKRAATKPTD